MSRRSANASAWANLRALVGLLWSEREGRRVILPAVVIKGLADLVALHSLGEAMVQHRAGLSVSTSMGVFIVAALLALVVGARARARASRLLGRAVPRLVHEIARRSLLADLDALEAVGRPKIERAITVEASRVLEVSQHLVWFLSEATFAAAGLIYFSLYSARAALLSVLVLLGSAAVLTWRGVGVERLSDTSERHQAKLLELLDGLRRGFAQLKLHRPRAHALEAHFGAEVERHHEVQRAYYYGVFSSHAIAEALLFSLLGLVVFAYARLAPEVGPELDRLVIAGLFFFEPVTMIVLDQIDLARGGEALRRMYAVSEALAPSEPRAREPREPPTDFEALELRGLSYTHAAQDGRAPFTVGPIDLRLRPGELLFVTGPNGSGKSTFLRLLTGLYSASQGQIVLDGQPLSGPVPQRYREHFGVIFSERFLVDSPRGHQVRDRARAQALLEQMELTQVVELGERGLEHAGLSTGQRKRLAMVHALLQDRPILVLDEWAAEQDPRFRAQFYRRLLPELKERGKAVIVVTHDDRHFASADRRLHLQRGRAVDPPRGAPAR